MSITESTLKITNNRPRIVYYDIVFKTDSLEPSNMTLIANSCIKLDIDIKNKQVIMYIAEFDVSNFYDILNNIFASSNIGLLVTRKNPMYSGNIKTYNNLLPIYKFTQGSVYEHHTVVDTRNDCEEIHAIKIKFVKFSTSTNINETL